MPNGSIEFCTLNNNLRQIVSVTADLAMSRYRRYLGRRVVTRSGGVLMSRPHLLELEAALVRKGWRVTAVHPGNEYDISAAWEIQRSASELNLSCSRPRRSRRPISVRPSRRFIVPRLIRALMPATTTSSPTPMSPSSSARCRNERAGCVTRSISSPTRGASRSCRVVSTRRTSDSTDPVRREDGSGELLTTLYSDALKTEAKRKR